MAAVEGKPSKEMPSIVPVGELILASEAARVANMTRARFQQLAASGKGPRFIRLGENRHGVVRVYIRSDVAYWRDHREEVLQYESIEDCVRYAFYLRKIVKKALGEYCKQRTITRRKFMEEAIIEKLQASGVTIEELED